ncbi:MAG: alkaline phosphatase PhoX, partial [Bacteroidota bacterium]
MSVSRRHFLRQASLLGVGMLGLQHYACVSGAASSSKAVVPGRKVRGYGLLKADDAGILKLPEGFSYRIISRQGDEMTDGLLVPGKGDGMATFTAPNGKTIIIRNHELSPEMTDLGPFGYDLSRFSKVPAEKLYDAGFGQIPSMGGTTTMVFDTRTQRVDYEFMSLAGTCRNCAGGPTPWNTWISCEETVLHKGGRIEANHGYNFEVPAQLQPKLVEPVPIKAMGRFQHEAIAVDPRSGVVYQTEDRHDSLIYRYLPDHPGKLHKGGKLQIMALVEYPGRDTRNWGDVDQEDFPIGMAQAVEWLDIDDIENMDDTLRKRGYAKGAARFARGEGMWYANGAVFFCCTNGGRKYLGQIFRYTPSQYEGQAREADAPGMLELFIEPNRSKLLQHCDNLTVGPDGHLVVCEDTEHP